MTLPAALAVQVRELGIDPDAPDLLEQVQAEIRRRCEAQAERRRLLERQLRAYPLAGSVLWRADSAPWDQRRSVLAAMTSPVVTLVLGGERSGKSLGLKQLTLAMALGGDHPVVQAWGRLNDLPVHRIPPGPAEVYAAALTSSDSRKYHRPDFAEMVGELPHLWRALNGDGESSLTITVPGYKRPGIIHFKSIDQGSRSFQGISLRWCWLDEEPEGHEGKACYVQVRARVMDQDGRCAISMVPRLGFTWVHKDLVKEKQDQCVVVKLNSLLNPHLPAERAASHFAGMDEKSRAVHQFGEFTSREGAIYPMWQPGDGTREGMGHTCEPFPIPAHWTRFRAVDFGLDNPTCVLWAALGEGDEDGILFIYREYYVANGLSFPWHAERVRAIECGQQVLGEDDDYAIVGEAGEQEPIEAGWGDPASLQGREAFAAAGVGVDLADNDLQRGYDIVRDRLRQRGNHRPAIKVFSTCINTVREMGELRKDPKRIDVVQIKKDDHAADTVRYLCCGVQDWSSVIAC